jgi:hypothetical protein
VNARNIKIEASGDFWLGKINPKIRLCGKWLDRAGFKAGERVEVTVSELGVMTLRAQGEEKQL